MKILARFVPLLFIHLTAYSQYSSNFETLTEDLVPTDTIAFEERYKNGSLKERGTLLLYKVGEVSMEFYSGKYYQYFKNGEVKMDAEFDQYGNLLFQKCYDRYGGICSHSETLEIDTTAKNLKEFLVEDEHLKIVSHDKFYTYSLKADTPPFLRQEGKMINNKKIGVWKTYNRTGEIKKEKEF